MPRKFLAALTLSAALLQGCSGTKIDGRYKDSTGSTVEFLADGTVVFVIRGIQAVWKWSIYDGNKLKLEPTGGMNAKAAMCSYQLNETTLRVTECEYAMVLTRL